MLGNPRAGPGSGGNVPSICRVLSIANLDFDDFADAVDQDGVFRGFPR
jgi:hypothetical protein